MIKNKSVIAKWADNNDNYVPRTGANVAAEALSLMLLTGSDNVRNYLSKQTEVPEFILNTIKGFDEDSDRIDELTIREVWGVVIGFTNHIEGEIKQKAREVLKC